MTSRRPMTRSFSGNGRTSSFSEEEGSSSNGRSESRNPYLSDVRPENSYSRYSHYRPLRSTLCSVMAHLSEDIQPSFETTLKSKSVSENCNVKFTCVVSGYPAPELKWYKDDMEMDRYCGLPKYEIHRNGKTHTLHIYNCTLDDAAIYQASASNSKGIVSCSGVLEVGIMDEYKIHQRFFAKLKQKAEKKKKSMEDQKDKENMQKEKPLSTPERPPRKRHVPLPQDRLAVKQSEAVEQRGATAEPNGISPEVTESGLDKEIPPSEEALAKKKIKISNGLDADINSSSSSKSHTMVNGNENCYDGGMSLAQFLAETIQSKSAEDKPQELDAHVLNVSTQKGREQDAMQNEKGEEEKVQQEEREKRREVDLSISREEESPLDVVHATAHNKHGSEVKHHSKTHKDDHHNIQASFSSMLHTVKDFFFGKSKKDSCERELDSATTQPPLPGTPPSFRLQTQHNPNVCEPMETDKPIIQSPGSVVVEKQSALLELHEHKRDDSDLRMARPSAHTPASGSPEERTGQGVTEAGDAVDAVEASREETGSSSPGEESGIQGLNEEDKDSLVVTVIKEVPVNRQEPDCLSSPHPNQKRDESAPRESISIFPQSKAAYEEECPPTPTLISLEESWTPPENIMSDSHSLIEATTKQDEEMKVDKVGKEEEPDTESFKLCEEEKAEVKSSKQTCSFINASEMPDLTTSTLEGRTDTCEPNAPHQVLSPLRAGSERQNAKEETKCTTLVQEVHVGGTPTAASENLEMGDLKIKNERTASIVEESTDTNSTGAVPTSTFSKREKSNHFGEVLNFALEEDIKAEQEAVAEDEGHDVRDERSQLVVESGQNVEELDKPQILSVTQNEGSNTNALENCSNDICEEGLGWSSDKVPQIHISTTEDTPDVSPTAPHENQNEQFIIPEIEVMEPEYKECSVPLSILALNKSESEPAVVQKHDVTRMSEIRIQNQGTAQPPGMLPTQRSMQNDYNLSRTEKVTEVSQFDDETEKLERAKGSEQPPQTDYSSIPVINVSCTDDKEDHVQESSTLHPTETPTVPVFEALPVSAGCQEIETLLVTQSGTKTNVGTDVTVKPEKNHSTNQTLLEMEERSISKTMSSQVDEALTPKVRENISLFSKSPEDNPVEILVKPPIKTESILSLDDLLKNKVSVERLTCKPPAHPSLSPGSLRKFMSRAAADADNEAVKAVPVITVGDHQSDKADEDLSGGSTPTSSLSCESSPRLKRRDSLTLIRSATPEELASGARRKIFMPKAKEDGEGAAVGALDAPGKKESPYMSPSQARRAALLQAPPGQNTPPMERRSPLLSRRKATLEVPKVTEEAPKEEPASTKREEKPAEKKPDPLKAPQVIRKIRGEPFPDASGHLKLWCQFFNVLSDSTIKWYRDEEEILELKRCGGDESQVALAIVLASSPDCGVYGCTIDNDYGTDSTDFLLSEDVLSEILLKDDLEVGEEIEMTPMVFAKGLGDCGSWGDKYFGRIMTEAVHIGAGCAHKASRVKVIYGLDPVFESGSSCIMKVRNPVAYGTKQDNTLAERSLQMTKQECKVQNTIREYCKIFAAEARVSENFGFSLEVIPQYLMYRPANSVPYASVEADMEGAFSTYCMMDPKGKLITHTASEVEQKCSTFQHWIHQWTHGNLLVTRLEGVETKLTNVRVVTKSKGYQGLTESGSPEIFEQFLTHHQCNYYCGLLGLRPLKTMEGLQQPTKMKGSRSPLVNRKLGSGSPQTSRKPNCSPKAARKVQEKEDTKSDTKPKSTETVDAVETR